MTTLIELSKLTVPGVYCFINDSNKQVYLGYGFNVLNSLQRILTEYKSNSLSNSQLQNNILSCRFELIETLPSTESFSLKERTAYWIRYYMSIGYQVMNDKMPINLSVIVYIESNMVNVALRSSNRQERLLGVFKSKDEADEFIVQYKRSQLY